MIRQIILILILSAALASSFQGAVLNIQEIELDANSTKIFKLPNIDGTKALMINVKHDEDKILNGTFKVLLTKDDNSQTNCFFKYTSNLCVLQKPTSGLKVEVKCLEQACKISLVFSQRGILNLQQSKRKKISLRGDILVLPKKSYNTIMQIFAQKEEHHLLSSQIKVYSNIHAFHLPQIQQIDMNSAVYGLKPVRKEQDQYIFIDYSINRTEFLQVQFKSNDGKLSEGISVTDFIENYGKHSHSNYTFTGDFKKNIQIKMRLFAPKDTDGLPIILKVLGKKTQNQPESAIRSLKFQPINFQGHSFYDFSFSIAHSVHSLYEIISFQILIVQVEDKAVFFEISVYDVDVSSINIFEHIFFGCSAKDELKFSVEPQVKLELSGGEKEIQIVTNSNQKYFTNIQTCSLHKGCQISIKADEICNTCSYSFDLQDEQFKNHVIYYQVTNNIIEGKIDFEQELFFKYALNGKGMVQIIVNSPNVMIYANLDEYQRCKLPTSACHQYVANHQNPVVIKNPQTIPTEITVGVLGLEKASFTVKFLTQQNGLTVKLGEKLTYHMDDEEEDIDIRMEIKRQQFIIGENSIHFNLISPIHSTKLTVTNGQKVVQSNNGYITILKNDVGSELFVINIQKINAYQGAYLHFALIVTSSQTKVRLETSAIHYEQYKPNINKTFVFEYDSRDSTALNIYTQNLQKSRAKMTITLSNVEEIQGEKKIITTRSIVMNNEFIDISSFIEEGQICGQVSCELELMISNDDGKATLQQSITLLSENSLINLDDSIWSAFQINQLTKRSHFYFVPRQKNKPITIIFNTDDNRLYLNYRIFSTKNNQNPQNWPFDHQETDKVGHISNSQTLTISPEDPELVKCWPDCVIIMNLNEVSAQKATNQSQIIQTYKILATNSLFQLPQNTKLQFSMRSQQEKSLFISIADILSYQRLTFFTYFSFGRAKISAEIFYEQKLYKIGKYRNSAFQDLETIIYTVDILQTLGLEMIPKESALLQIIIRAETAVKMTLQYTSYLREMYKLRMDELQFLSLKAGQKVWYEFIPERDFNIKLYRLKGFPIVQVIKCQEVNYVQCLSNSKNVFEADAEQLKKQSDIVKKDLSKQNSQAIVTTNTSSVEVMTQKSFDYKGEACQKCIYFLWIYEFEGDLQMTLNLRTSNSQIELKDQSSINDQVIFKQRNRYLINILPRKNTIISIKVLEGGVGYLLTDSAKSYQNGTIAFGENSYRDIVIDGQDDEQQSSDEGQGKLRSYSDNKIFKHVHLSIYGLTEKPSEYIVSYSVGESSLFLQDGVVAEKHIGPYRPHTFYYHNKNKKQHAYLTLSSEPVGFSQQVMSKDYEILFYYYPDASNRHEKELFKPQKPPKRNQNYLGSTQTSVYQLPTKYQLIEIYITSMEELNFFASINHQELIYLPLEFEYLIKLHQKQSLNLVIDNPKTEYLEVNVKKCDGSLASIMYTNDAKQFRKGIFEVEKQIDSHIFKQYIKTKKDSKTIHLKISTQENQSLLSITVRGRAKQSKQQKISFKPGDSGRINYRLGANKKAQVIFKPATCNEKECSVEFNYFLVIAESIEQIYGELNCAGIYFVPQASSMLKKGAQVIFVGKQFYNKELGQFIYPVTLSTDSSFIGVKAVVSDSDVEVRYLPIQIGNIWSQLKNVSPGLLMLGSFVLALLLTILIIVSTKLARRGYKPISSQQ